MKRCIVSYSMTGNNERLAKALKQPLEADLILVKEEKKRSNFTIVLDNLFGRTPKLLNDVSEIDQYEQIIFIGPVWMQMPPSPLRAYFKTVRKTAKPYSFVTISGGALNKNPNLKKNIRKSAGHQIHVLKDLYIADLIKSDKPTTEETGSYKLSEEDIKLLANDVIKSI